MNIFFFDLVVFYATFVDWAALFRRLGKGLPDAQAPEPRYPTALIASTGGILVSAAFLFWVLKIEAGWPFACYPTFANIAGPQATILICYRVGADGTIDRIDVVKDLSSKTPAPPHRIHHLLQRILASPPEVRPDRMRALWGVMERAGAAYSDAQGIEFYNEVLWVDPDRQHENPIRREVLFEWSRGGDLK